MPQSLTSMDLILFARQIADGMGHLASHGLVHRTLCAEHVLVNSMHKCQLSDYFLDPAMLPGGPPWAWYGLCFG
jgi:hypothetical protein